MEIRCLFGKVGYKMSLLKTELKLNDCVEMKPAPNSGSTIPEFAAFLAKIFFSKAKFFYLSNLD